MNYNKMDARLSAVMSEDSSSLERTLNVSVRTLEPPDEDQQQELQSLGVYGVSGEGRVFSAQLSPHAVSELSDKSWIRLLSLAHELKSVNDR